MLDGDSSDEEMTDAPKAFVGSGFRLDGRPIRPPKTGASPPSGSMLGGGPSTGVKIGVRIGGDGSILGSSDSSAAGTALGGGGGGFSLGGGRTLSGAPPQPPPTLPTAAPAAPPSSSSGGQTLGGRPADGIERLGLAAKTAPVGDDYWAKLSGGNKLR